MAMGAITRTSLRDTAVDFSYPYFTERTGFMTRKPSPLPKVMAILRPYKIKVWTAFAIALVAFNIVYWMVCRIYNKGFSPSFNLGKIILQVCQLTVTKGNNTNLGKLQYWKKFFIINYVVTFIPGIKQWPITQKSHIFAILWTLYAVVVVLGITRQIRASEYFLIVTSRVK